MASRAPPLPPHLSVGRLRQIIKTLTIVHTSPPEDAHPIIEGLKKVVRPGGMPVWRGGRPPGALAGAFTACGLDVDEDLSARALEAETSFFHNEVCVATTRRSTKKTRLVRAFGQGYELLRCAPHFGLPALSLTLHPPRR